MEVYVSSIQTRAFGRYIEGGCCTGVAVKRGSTVFKPFHLIGLELVTITDSYVTYKTLIVTYKINFLQLLQVHFLQVCVLRVYYIQRPVVQKTIYYLNKSDTEMSVSTHCSEPSRPWAVVSQAKQGHY